MAFSGLSAHLGVARRSNAELSSSKYTKKRKTMRSKEQRKRFVSRRRLDSFVWSALVKNHYLICYFPCSLRSPFVEEEAEDEEGGEENVPMLLSLETRTNYTKRPWLKVDSATVSIQFQLRNQSAFITSRRRETGRERQRGERVGCISKIFMLI